MNQKKPKFQIGQLVIDDLEFVDKDNNRYCYLITGLKPNKAYECYKNSSDFLYCVDVYKIDINGKTKFCYNNFHYLECQLKSFQETIDDKVQMLERKREELLKLNDVLCTFQNSKKKEKINGK